MDAEARVLMDSIERAKERLSPPKPKAASPAVSPSKPAAASNGSASPGKADDTESIRLKNAGNDAMKENDYPRAIELYTEAIALDPSNMMFFNNRAQAFLKMSDFSAAEADSSTVIDSNKRLPNLKALFRRALARKGMGTKQSLTAAQEDISIILKAEPSNKEAAKEKQRVAALLATATADEAAAIARAASLAAVPAPESAVTEGLVARTTRIKTPAKAAAEQVSADSGTRTPNSAASSVATTPSSGSKKPSPGVKKVVVQNPLVPTEPPKTVYELERVWRGLKNRPELFADYLKTFKKSTFKKVLKETCSPDLVSSMLVSVRDHLVRLDTSTAFNVLEGLASTSNFGMTVSLLPSVDIECVTACIEHLTEHVDRSRGMKLKEAYKI
jgi:tetratricopeptide (TPR) repeat protein